MPHARTRLGDYGEQTAERFLAAQGWRLIERKWRCTFGEIDLVMRDGAEIVFVEVRTRSAGRNPEESVGPHKQRRLANLAYAYLQQAGCDENAAWRIDVVAVVLSRGGRPSLRHIRHAVEL
jgi:putative endonuclease